MVPFLLMTLAASGPSLASPEFNTLNVKEDVSRFCNEHLAQQLSARGVQVTTARQISTMLGLERQKQLMGCAESSCMAELSSALGVDGVVLGDLGRLGSKFQINLRVTRSSNGSVVATWARTVDSEEQLLGAFTDAAEALAPQLFTVFRPEAKPPPVALVNRTHTWPLVPTIVASGLAVAAIVAGVFTATAYGTLVDTTKLPGTVDGLSVAAQGKTANWVMLGSAVGAGLSLAVAAIIFAIGRVEQPLHAALSPWLNALAMVP